MRLARAHALVTGCSRGIGPHIARALAQAGADVVVTARTPEPLESLSREIGAMGVRVGVVTANLSDQGERERLVREAEQALGPLDVLVNNAGVENEGPFTELDAETIAATVLTNVVAPMQLVRLVVPGMLERRRGHIVNIASLAGRKAPPYDAVYGGTKAAIVEWTNALRIELRGTGVGLSTVSPGYVRDEGMFSRFGLAPPALLGSCTSRQVAAGVLKAIERDRAEVLVNSLPVRPFLALYALAPGVFDWLLTAAGVTKLQRRKAARRR